MTERAQSDLFGPGRGLGFKSSGSRHGTLLLGLIKEGQGVAARSLQNLQINIEQVREQVIQVIGKGETNRRRRVLPRAKKVLNWLWTSPGVKE